MLSLEGAEQPLVTQRARALFQDWLKATQEPETFVLQMPLIQGRIREIIDEFLPAVYERLDDEEPFTRVFVAHYLLTVEAADREIVAAPMLEKARSAVLNILEHGDAFSKFLCCATLKGCMPEGAHHHLQNLFSGDDVNLKVAAAAALSHCDQIDPEVVRILNAALRTEDPLFVKLSADALAKVGIKRPDALSGLLAMLQRKNPMIQLDILLALEQIGVAARPALSTTEEIALDASNPPFLRGKAAHLLGVMTHGTTDAHAALTKCLKSADVEVVEGTLLGFKASGKLPPSVMRWLTSHLGSNDPVMRRVVCKGITLAGARASAALPSLVERFVLENDHVTYTALVDATAAIGVPALLPLMEMVCRQDPRCTTGAMSALAQLCLSHANEFADCMFSSANPTARQAAVSILKELGVQAAGVLPKLIAMLPSASDETAFHLLGALEALGDVLDTRRAVPEVVRRLESNEEATVLASRRALKSIFKTEASTLRSLLESTTGNARQQIESVLSEVAVRSESQVSYLAKLNRDDLLELFVCIGCALRLGGSLSWPSIANCIAANVASGNMRPPHRGAGASKLRLATKELSGLLNCSLTKHSQSKPGELTEHGLKLLFDAMEYLEARGNSPLLKRFDISRALWQG